MPISNANLKASCERALCRRPFLARPGQRFCSIRCGVRAGDPRLAATAKPSDLDVAWAAGIYEGEGSVFLNVKTWGLQVTVGQRDDWLLHRLRDLFGGSVHVRSGASSFSGRNIPVWVVGGDRARVFLAAIYPWLSPRRRQQADAALVERAVA